MTAAVPEQVAREAARHGFGEMLDARQKGSPSGAVTVGCGGALVGIAVLVAAALLPEPSALPLWRSVGHQAAGALFLAIVALGTYGLRGLVLGARHHYLYAGGLVQRGRSRVYSVAWRDVVRLRAVHARAKGRPGKLLGYRVEARDGRTFRIAARLSGRDPFLDRLIDCVRREGGAE